MKKILMYIIAATILIAGLLIFTQTAHAASISDVSIKESEYGRAKNDLNSPTYQAVYVPGETLEIKVAGTIGTDITVKTKFVEVVNFTTNYTTVEPGIAGYIGASGNATITYPIALGAKDGKYIVSILANGTEIYNSTNYSTSFSITNDAGSTVANKYEFYVTSYAMSGGPNRGTYIRGDTVLLSYSVNSYKNGSTPTGGTGKWELYDRNMTKVDVSTFTSGAGTIQYAIPSNYASTGVHKLRVTYEDSNGKWKAEKDFSFTISSLSLGVSVVGGTTQTLGGTLQARLQTNVPNCTISSVTLQKIQNGLTVGASKQIDVGSLQTDENCVAVVTQQLDTTTYQDKDVYRITAIAQTASGASDTKSVDFTIRTENKTIVGASTDKTSYISGENVQINVKATKVPAQSLGNILYIYTIKNVAGNAVLYTTTSANSQLVYTVPSTFAGNLRVDVEVTSDTGIYEKVSTISFNVAYGNVLLNGPSEYNPSESVTINYQVASNVMSSPTVIYTITGADGFEIARGQITSSGSGSFSFDIPSVPSSSYTVTVTAVKSGKSLTNMMSLYKATGVQLSTSFDKQAYAPGDTVKIRYQMIAKESGKSLAFPQAIMVMIGQKTQNFQVNSASGEISFVLPSDIGEGSTFIGVYGAAGGSAVSAISVKKSAALSDVMGTGAFDATVMSMSVISLLIGIVVVLKVFGIINIGGRTKPPYTGTPTKEQPHMAIPPHQSQQPPHTTSSAQQPTPQPVSQPQQSTTAPPKATVRCFKCGSDIEVTSAERPLIVTCNKCGEKGMLT